MSGDLNVACLNLYSKVSISWFRVEGDAVYLQPLSALRNPAFEALYKWVAVRNI